MGITDNQRATAAKRNNKCVMSTFAARIMNKHSDHRKSSADLQGLLEREENALAIEKERQLQKAQHPRADLNGEYIDSPKESNKSSSRSGSDDETDWQSQSGCEQDDEFEDSQLVSICTVAGAEDHLVNHLDDIAYVCASTQTAY
jgi:hypothetical protein